MTLSSVQTYTDESLKQCKELMAILRKRVQIEADYAKQMSKLSASILTREEPDDETRQQVRRTCTWRSLTKYAIHLGNVSETHRSLSTGITANLLGSFQVLIKEMESVRKTQVDRGLEIEKALQESYSSLKKAKNEMEIANNAVQDAAYQHTKAKVSNSTKNTEKYQAKLTSANEKAGNATDAVKMCEELCKEAQDLFYMQRLPQLYDSIKNTEMDRCSTIKRIFLDAVFCEKMQSEGRLAEFDLLQEALTSIDVSEDIEEFADTQMNDELDRSNQATISVRSLVNAKKQGRLQLKKGDVVSGWKGKYYVLMEDERQLYCFDNEASTKPRDILPLVQVSVHDLDDSYFGRAHCFQLYHTTTKQVYNLAADSQAEKLDWLSVLRPTALCCEKTDELTPNYETKPNEVDNLESYQIRRNIVVEVIEAKELAGTSFTQGTTPYCVVMFDDTKFAKTGMRSGETPFWSDSFEVSNICPHTKKIRVVVYNHNRLYKDVDIGYVTIDISKLTPGKRTEQWWTLVESDMDMDDSKGQLKIAVTLNVDKLLPVRYYNSFSKIILEPTFKCSRMLSTCVGPAKEKLARMLLNVLISENQANQGILNLLQEDIDNTETPNVIFRGNTLATKIVDAYMKEVGQDYLNDTLGTLIKQVYSSKDSCEVDPTRVEQEQLPKNLKKLLQTTMAFWDAINKSKSKCPSELIIVFSGLRKIIIKRWPEAKQQNLPVLYSAISAFIFLRFFCPAILNPKLFSLASDHPAQNTMRTLTLVAKIIQNLANLAEFGAKEPYMNDCNSLIESNLAGMKSFLDYLCNEQNANVGNTTKDSRVSKTSARRNLEQLFVFYQSNKDNFMNSLNEQQAKEKDVEELIEAIDDLEFAHNSFSPVSDSGGKTTRPQSTIIPDHQFKSRAPSEEDLAQYAMLAAAKSPPMPTQEILSAKFAQAETYDSANSDSDVDSKGNSNPPIPSRVTRAPTVLSKALANSAMENVTNDELSPSVNGISNQIPSSFQIPSDSMNNSTAGSGTNTPGSAEGGLRRQTTSLVGPRSLNGNAAQSTTHQRSTSALSQSHTPTASAHKQVMSDIMQSNSALAEDGSLSSNYPVPPVAQRAATIRRRTTSNSPSHTGALASAGDNAASAVNLETEDVQSNEAPREETIKPKFLSENSDSPRTESETRNSKVITEKIQRSVKDMVAMANSTNSLGGKESPSSHHPPNLTIATLKGGESGAPFYPKSPATTGFTQSQYALFDPKLPKQNSNLGRTKGVAASSSALDSDSAVPDLPPPPITMKKPTGSTSAVNVIPRSFDQPKQSPGASPPRPPNPASKPALKPTGVN